MSDPYARETTPSGQGGDERDTVVAALQRAVEVLGQAQAARDAGTVPGPDALSEDPEYKRAKKRAMNMLAARAHSAHDLRTKLLRKEHPADIVDQLIARLESAGLLDDAEYASSYVRAKRESRALSKSALRRELRNKGVADSHIAAALADIDDEFDLAYEVAAKKAASTVRLPRDTRKRRILGMLARRGFAQGACLKATEAALESFPGS